ncbi:DUF1513 domain-containing protein [Pseudophaeobacter sp.]|uniref:DUF1513 domain-containing protein n=1 Tax=Pseudophaeobacter sp. TaxID=1971739 RepID=UPI003296DF48
MTSRRGFIAGLLASGLAPSPSWADLGGPAFLSAAKDPTGNHLLAGLSDAGAIRFTCPLPGRGHAAAAHPHRPEAVAFARRPGRFADVIDCRDGARLARLLPPTGHHFYGHGRFSPDGSRLFTTENDFENAQGVIGVWEVKQDYRRIRSFSSGGIGPHDMLLWNMGGEPQLVIANGGIETHPDSGRAKLNLPEMRSNLTLMSLEGEPQEVMELSQELQLNSIRHLCLSPDGTIGFAMQWQGDSGAVVPIVGLYQPGSTPRLLAAEDPRLRGLQGYGGSVAFTPDGAEIAVSSPRGGLVQVMQSANAQIIHEYHLRDVCGLATSPSGLLASTGLGQTFALKKDLIELKQQHDLAWDNHLVPLI